MLAMAAFAGVCVRFRRGFDERFRSPGGAEERGRERGREGVARRSQLQYALNNALRPPERTRRQTASHKNYQICHTTYCTVLTTSGMYVQYCTVQYCNCSPL